MSKENNKNIVSGRRTLIGTCISIMGIFVFIGLRHLYVCSKNGGRMDCTLDDFFIELSTLGFITVILLIAIYKYDWVAPRK